MLKLLPYHKKTTSRLLKPCLAAYVSMGKRCEPFKCTPETYRRCHNWYPRSTKKDSFMHVKKSNLQLYRAFSSAEYGDMSGTWFNELGSVIDLTQSEDGELSGVYHNNAPDSAHVEEKVVGSMGKGVSATFGFTVNFEDGKWTTSWCGEYFKEAGVDNKEVLRTTWIMTARMPNSTEYWESTNIGQDRFTREPQKPTQSLANNGIRVIPRGMFTNLDTLEFLSLANNSIETIREHAFQGLTQLGTLELQNNDLKEWHGDPTRDMPLLEVLKINGNDGWLPNQQLLNMPKLKEILGVTWNTYCSACNLIKIPKNETLFGDDEMEDNEEYSGDGLSGEEEKGDMNCQVTFKEFFQRVPQGGKLWSFGRVCEARLFAAMFL